jgi:hypothetical protein
VATRSKITQAIADRPGPDADEDIPEWAKPAPAPEQTQAPIEGQVASATPALDNLLEWLVSEAGQESEGSASGMEAIIRQVLTAEDTAQVLRQTLPGKAEDWLGIPVLLTGFTIRESEFEGSASLPYYASMDVMAGQPPEPRVINVGAMKILAQLKRFAELDAFPVMVEIREAKAAKKGQSAPLTLSEVDITRK